LLLLEIVSFFIERRKASAEYLLNL